MNETLSENQASFAHTHELEFHAFGLIFFGVASPDELRTELSWKLAEKPGVTKILILYLILIIDGIDIYLPFQIQEPHLSIT